MRVMTTRSHGFLDVGAGVLLLAAPWLLGFARGGAETWMPVLVGLALLSLSVLTDYEIGRLKRIEMPVHLWLDAGAGLLLAVSPWLFGFYDEVWAPHLVGGLVLVVAAAFSATIPGYERRGAARAEG